MCYVCMCPREGREVTSLGLEVTGSCELPDMALGTSAVLGRSPARADSAITLNLFSPATVILLFQPPCPFQNRLFFAVFSFLRDGLCSPGWPGNSLCLVKASLTFATLPPGLWDDSVCHIWRVPIWPKIFRYSLIASRMKFQGPFMMSLASSFLSLALPCVYIIFSLQKVIALNHLLSVFSR